MFFRSTKLRYDLGYSWDVNDSNRPKLLSMTDTDAATTNQISLHSWWENVKKRYVPGYKRDFSREIEAKMRKRLKEFSAEVKKDISDEHEEEQNLYFI